MADNESVEDKKARKKAKKQQLGGGFMSTTNYNHAVNDVYVEVNPTFDVRADSMARSSSGARGRRRRDQEETDEMGVTSHGDKSK